MNLMSTERGAVEAVREPELGEEGQTWTVTRLRMTRARQYSLAVRRERESAHVEAGGRDDKLSVPPFRVAVFEEELDLGERGQRGARLASSGCALIRAAASRHARAQRAAAASAGANGLGEWGSGAPHGAADSWRHNATAVV